MRNTLFKTLLLVVLSAISVKAWSQNAFAVRATQNGDNIIVTYYLDAPAKSVQLTVSTDGGKSFSAPLQKVSGDLENLSAGRHSITWNVLEEYDSLVGDEIVFEVLSKPGESNKVLGLKIQDSPEQWVNGRTVGRSFGKLYWKDTGKKLTEEEYRKFLGEKLYKEYSYGSEAYWGASWMNLFTIEFIGGGVVLLATDNIGWGVTCTVLGAVCFVTELIEYSIGISTINAVKNEYNSQVKTKFSPSLKISPSVSKTYNSNYAMGAILSLKF